MASVSVIHRNQLPYLLQSSFMLWAQIFKPLLSNIARFLVPATFRWHLSCYLRCSRGRVSSQNVNKLESCYLLDGRLQDRRNSLVLKLKEIQRKHNHYNLLLSAYEVYLWHLCLCTARKNWAGKADYCCIDNEQWRRFHCRCQTVTTHGTRNTITNNSFTQYVVRRRAEYRKMAANFFILLC